MKTGPAIAEILKKEGVEYLFAYPVNHLIEACAAVDIRPIIVRQERIGLHMADAMSRLSKGRRMGVFCMQSGPGSENAYGGVAQAFGESVPLLVIPQGYPRRIAHVPPNFNSTLAMAHVAKHSEPGPLCMQNTPIRRPLVSRDMASAMCRPMRSWRTMMGRMSTAAQASIR